MHLFEKFVYEYTGPRIAIIATGAGISLCDIAKIPGASKVLESIYIPYAQDETKKIIKDIKGSYPDKFVSKEVSEIFIKYLEKNDNTPHIPKQYIGITGALTTSRYRKGENVAFVSFKGRINSFNRISLKKLNQDEYNKMTREDINLLRFNEDQTVTKIILDTLLKKE